MVTPINETQIAILGGKHRNNWGHNTLKEDILIFDTRKLTVERIVSDKFPYTTEVSSCIMSKQGQILAITRSCNDGVQIVSYTPETNQINVIKSLGAA